MMSEINVASGLLTGAKQCPSPNYDDRPSNCEPSLIVLHNISLPPGQFGGQAITQLFTNSLDPEEHDFFKEISHLRVASHLLIRRCGEVLQYVPFHKRAFHAGVSSFQGRERCNDFSIGIELEGSDCIIFTNAQYFSLIKIIKEVCSAYPKLDYKMITGHEHIAPGRKTDPGPCFDWQRLAIALQCSLPAKA